MYSSSSIATFPSSIILSANFDETGSFIVNEDDRWKIIDGNIVIPKKIKLASIIDGQHRIEGIKRAIDDGTFIDFEILCSVYIDMPFPQQAEIFTSINYNQKKVDKSIAYELFGYDLDSSVVDEWSPDTLAVYFARILNNDETSPLYGRIHTSFEGAEKNSEWFVSTACIVECICLLITNDATKDRYTIHQNSLFGSSGRKRLKDLRSNAPLRSLYIQRQDKDIYDLIVFYLEYIKSLSWFSNPDLVTTKTIGFIALFEIMKEILSSKSDFTLDSNDVSFMKNIKLESLDKKAFSFSGIGKAQLKEIIKKEM